MADRYTPARLFTRGEVSSVQDDETIAEAAKRLAKENVGAMPVYDHDKHLKGMITDRDIVVDVIAQKKDPNTTRVGDIVHENVVTVDANDPVEQAMHLMAEYKIRRLPVVEGERCIGIISQADIARTMPAEETGELVAVISTD